MQSSRSKIAIAATAAVLALATLSGCSGSAGGSTTCGSYLNMSSSGQTKAVTKMLQSHGGSTSNGNITLTKLSVAAYCRTIGSNSSTIDGVYGG